MQKAPVMKGSGLIPLTDDKSSSAEEVHVFGRNLEERVVNNEDSEAPSISFNTIEDDIDSIRKRKFDAITGEEDEETIFQGDFKLFVWDKTTSNWIEKGRGQLKLNDSINQDEKKSRLIMRVNGTLRILLNVSIRGSYFRVITNSKTHIRFTDSQTVWAASGSNAGQLKDLIEERRRMTTEEENELRKRAKKEGDDEDGDVSDKGTGVSEINSKSEESTNEEKTATTTTASSTSTTTAASTTTTTTTTPTEEEEENKSELEKEDSSTKKEVKKVPVAATAAKETTNGEVKVADEGGDES